MKNTNRIALDYLGHPIKLGDRVIFPAGAEQMEGEVVKIHEGSRQIGVKNDSGYTKNKAPKACVNVTLIRDKLPEYRL